MKNNGLQEQAKEMCKRIRESGNYNEALNIINDYVSIVSTEESQDCDEGFGSIQY